jgi:hypothetical protein
LFPNTLATLQTTSTAGAHLAYKQFLLEEQTLNKAEKSLMYQAGNQRPTVSNGERQNLEPKRILACFPYFEKIK